MLSDNIFVYININCILLLESENKLIKMTTVFMFALFFLSTN